MPNVTEKGEDMSQSKRCPDCGCMWIDHKILICSTCASALELAYRIQRQLGTDPRDLEIAQLKAAMKEALDLIDGLWNPWLAITGKEYSKLRTLLITDSTDHPVVAQKSATL